MNESTENVEPSMLKAGDTSDVVHNMNIDDNSPDDLVLLDDSLKSPIQEADKKECEKNENPRKKMGLQFKNLEEISIPNFGDKSTEQETVKLQSSRSFYNCEQCDFSVVGRSILKKHIQDNHGFPCDQCNYIATSRGNFWKHKRSNH